MCLQLHVLNQCRSLPQAGLKALLLLLDWSWSQLSQLPSSAPTHDIQHHAFIAKSAIEILKTYIQQTYPKKGKMSKPALDCSELAEAVYEARTMLIRILSTRRNPFLGKSERGEKQSLMSMVIEVCSSAFQTCFHAFYPTPPLKWFALCQQLQHFDPVSVQRTLYAVSVVVKRNTLLHIRIQCTFLAVVEMCPMMIFHVYTLYM